MHDHVHLVRVGDHVVVRHDDAGLVDDEARPFRGHRAAGLRRIGNTVEEVLEELVERTLRLRALGLLRGRQLLRGGDVHVRRHRAFGDVGKSADWEFGSLGGSGQQARRHQARARKCR